jgi:hypothetical protein
LHLTRKTQGKNSYPLDLLDLPPAPALSQKQPFQMG